MRILNYLMAALILTACTSTANQASEKEKNKDLTMYSDLEKYISSLKTEMDSIPDDRKELLKEMADFVRDSEDKAKLTFICTHNSRRSHLSQVWSAVAAYHYGFGDKVETYSGGTESTAFNPRAVAALERAGFEIENPGGENPRYQVSFSENSQAMECFSKKYDDPANPSEGFLAVMTCSHADETCPFIPGAALRIPIPYDDPKESDGTERETETYDERSRQIAAEMFYMMSKV